MEGEPGQCIAQPMQHALCAALNRIPYRQASVGARASIGKRQTGKLERMDAPAVSLRKELSWDAPAISNPAAAAPAAAIS